MEAFKLIPFVVLSLCIAGIIAGAALITLAEFDATTTDTTASLGIANASAGIAKITEQFPTLGIIAVMVIIISVLAGVFTYFRWFG